MKTFQTELQKLLYNVYVYIKQINAFSTEVCNAVQCTMHKMITRFIKTVPSISSSDVW